MDFLDNIFGNLFGGIDKFLSNLFGGNNRPKTFKKNDVAPGPAPKIEAQRMGVARPRPTNKGPSFGSIIQQNRAPC